jgi:hypothetical protein
VREADAKDGVDVPTGRREHRSLDGDRLRGVVENEHRPLPLEPVDDGGSIDRGDRPWEDGESGDER